MSVSACLRAYPHAHDYRFFFRRVVGGAGGGGGAEGGDLSFKPDLILLENAAQC